MEIKIHDSILSIPASEWNALLGNAYPFMRHEFLTALEQNNCTGEQFGWLARHIALYDKQDLIGAIPVFEKDNSYGEFVFDWSWAEAYQRNGLRYYPKWVSAAPYTPVAGPRILVRPAHDVDKIRTTLLDALHAQEAETDVSSIHFLFTREDDTDFLREKGYMLRLGCQFHWENRSYRDFQDFLDTFTSKKRKNVRQERRYAASSGATIEIIRGDRATEEQLVSAERFYRKTFDEKWGMATLNIGFFSQVAETMGDQLLLILARRNSRYVAGAICFQDEQRLYGRHWGCIEEHAHLHFECCFYQGIEYCIENGLQYFEPGAQGEHKISRGFLPTATWSAHRIRDERFRHAIHHFLQQETESMLDYIKELQTRSPYRSTA